ncbi:S-adenosyl-L-methionine-dependent methyltransferase [Trichoderma austrokoningii]
MSKPAQLPPSKLGTKEYWDTLYTTELANHAANPSDTGTSWFDDSDAEARIVSFLESFADDNDDISQQEASFLDLGCGNGSLLFALRDAGWDGTMLGTDYSAQSIALAKNIAKSKEEELKPVHFLQWDLLNDPLSSPQSYAPPSHLFDIILDKGTFDAISLSSGQQPCETYRRRLLQLLRPNGGIFLITSCNWTEPELRAWFADDADGELRVVGRVDYPTFTFGGVKGQTISTLCFRRGS